jgi:hypothetical protein
MRFATNTHPGTRNTNFTNFSDLFVKFVADYFAANGLSAKPKSPRMSEIIPKELAR